MPSAVAPWWDEARRLLVTLYVCEAESMHGAWAVEPLVIQLLSQAPTSFSLAADVSVPTQKQEINLVK